MRPKRLPARACAFALAIVLGCSLAGIAPALARKAAPAPAEPAGEVVEISGRIVTGLDKVFIKDAQGYCLVQGLDLSRFAGRNIQARGVVLKTEQEYRTVRLVEYRIQSPDDDSPGAGGAVRPGRK